jgi:hypothetical protein
VGEEHTRGNNAAYDREATAPSGWVTTQVAAKSLGISPRTVRWHIENGNLEAKPEGEGVRRSWLVSIDSVQAFRDSRQRQGRLPGGNRGERGDAEVAAESSGNAIRELADRLVEEAARASEFRVRLEIAEKAESTLREELVEERRRREEAERAREVLRRELEALRDPPDAAETVEEAPSEAGAESQPAIGEVREELSAERARREMAETTLHKGMAEQRRRREEAERERDELRREMFNLRERTEAHDTAEEHQGRGHPPSSATGGAQEGTQRPRSRPWWRRIIGG